MATCHNIVCTEQGRPKKFLPRNQSYSLCLLERRMPTMPPLNAGAETKVRSRGTSGLCASLVLDGALATSRFLIHSPLASMHRRSLKQCSGSWLPDAACALPIFGRDLKSASCDVAELLAQSSLSSFARPRAVSLEDAELLRRVEYALEAAPSAPSHIAQGEVHKIHSAREGEFD